MPNHLWAPAVPRVAVTAPVDALLVSSAPSPEKDETPPPAAFASTKAVVASFVVLSPTVCVVAVVPFGNAGVPERLLAVPVVFWFHVGGLVAFVRLIAEGVPRFGVVSTGEVAKTSKPVPVSSLITLAS